MQIHKMRQIDEIYFPIPFFLPDSFLPQDNMLMSEFPNVYGAVPRFAVLGRFQDILHKIFKVEEH